ncbi:hypothetical protein E2562_034540, partial [Oryza meyeriana var. granulata]
LLLSARDKNEELCFKNLMPRSTELHRLIIRGQWAKGLYVVSLWKLDTVPEGIGSLQTLKKLWLLDLHKDFRTQWHKNGMHQKMQHVPEVRV